MTFTTNNLEGVFTTSISSALVDYIENWKNPNGVMPMTTGHCFNFVYDRGVILTPAVIEQIESIFRFTTHNP